MTKPIKLSHINAKLAHGQLIIAGGTTMDKNQIQRPLNRAYNIARDGAPKPDEPAQIVPGQHRQTKPSHEFLHGAPIDDEKEPPIKSYERAIPIHPGMTKSQVDEVRPANSASAVFEEAANLGRKTKRSEKA